MQTIQRKILAQVTPVHPKKGTNKRGQKCKKQLEESAKSCIDIRGFLGSQNQSYSQSVIGSSETIEGLNTTRAIKLGSIQEYTTQSEDMAYQTSSNMETAKEGDDEVTFKGNQLAKGKNPKPPTGLSNENQQMMEYLSTLLEKHKEEIKADFKLEIRASETKINNLESASNIVSEQINKISEGQTKQEEVNSTLQTELEDLKSQVKLLTNTVVKHGTLIKEAKDVKETEDIRNTRNEMVIRGIQEMEKENCVQTIQNFIAQKLKIVAKISIVKAHRMGSGKDRPILLTLMSNADKGKIYKHVKNFKGVTNHNNQSYQVTDHLPAKTAESRVRQKKLKRVNNFKTVDQLEMSFNRGDLYIQGQRYKKIVAVPDDRSMLKSTKTDRMRWGKMKTVPGNVIKKERCEFHGFSVVASKIDTIRDAYSKLKELHGSARHISCAWRLPGANWPVLQDFQDNEEFGAGRHLLTMLQKAEIYNRAVFVVRYYGGTHLGPSRFNAFVEAAQSAITHDPYNYITKENQTPWPKDTNSDSNTQIGSSRNQRQLSGPIKGNPYNKNHPQSWYDRTDRGDQSWDEYYKQEWSLKGNRQELSSVTSSITELTRTQSDPILGLRQTLTIPDPKITQQKHTEQDGQHQGTATTT